jgi:signal transduction histidine kinase
MQAAHAARDGDYQTQVMVSGDDEISQLQRDFNAMIASLAATVSALETEREKVTTLLHLRHELIANVSHELRTPLATLRAALEGIQRRPALPLQAAELTLLQRETQLLQTLIEDLFALSRAETEQLSLHLVPLELPFLMKRWVETLAPLAWQQQRIQISTQIPVGLPPIMADAQRLEQVLRNLLHNSLRHTLPGGVILLTADHDEQRVRLQVRDSGSGIAPADLPHIWERYYHSEQGENGLGLTLVKSFMEAMGGAVSVTSILGEGTTFTLALPLAQPHHTSDLPNPRTVQP